MPPTPGGASSPATQEIIQLQSRMSRTLRIAVRMVEVQGPSNGGSLVGGPSIAEIVVYGALSVPRAAASVSELGGSRLKCPDNLKVATVDFASYGGPVNGFYEQCHDATSMSAAVSTCVGHSACKPSVGRSSPCAGSPFQASWVDATCASVPIAWPLEGTTLTEGGMLGGEVPFLPVATGIFLGCSTQPTPFFPGSYAAAATVNLGATFSLSFSIYATEAGRAVTLGDCNNGLAIDVLQPLFGGNLLLNVQKGEWTHAIYAFSSTSTYLYIDGRFAHALPPQNATGIYASITLGSCSAYQSFNGSMARLALWPGAFFSQADAQAEYAAATELACPPPPPTPPTSPSPPPLPPSPPPPPPPAGVVAHGWDLSNGGADVGTVGGWTMGSLVAAQCGSSQATFAGSAMLGDSFTVEFWYKGQGVLMRGGSGGFKLDVNITTASVNGHPVSLPTDAWTQLVVAFAPVVPAVCQFEKIATVYVDGQEQHTLKLCGVSSPSDTVEFIKLGPLDGVLNYVTVRPGVDSALPYTPWSGCLPAVQFDPPPQFMVMDVHERLWAVQQCANLFDYFMTPVVVVEPPSPTPSEYALLSSSTSGRRLAQDSPAPLPSVAAAAAETSNLLSSSSSSFIPFHPFLSPAVTPLALNGVPIVTTGSTDYLVLSYRSNKFVVDLALNCGPFLPDTFSSSSTAPYELIVCDDLQLRMSCTQPLTALPDGLSPVAWPYPPLNWPFNSPFNIFSMGTDMSTPSRAEYALANRWSLSSTGVVTPYGNQPISFALSTLADGYGSVVLSAVAPVVGELCPRLVPGSMPFTYELTINDKCAYPAWNRPTPVAGGYFFSQPSEFYNVQTGLKDQLTDLGVGLSVRLSPRGLVMDDQPGDLFGALPASRQPAAPLTATALPPFKLPTGGSVNLPLCSLTSCAIRSGALLGPSSPWQVAEFTDGNGFLARTGLGLSCAPPKGYDAPWPDAGKPAQVFFNPLSDGTFEMSLDPLFDPANGFHFAVGSAPVYLWAGGEHAKENLVFSAARRADGTVDITHVGSGLAVTIDDASGRVVMAEGRGVSWLII